MLSVREYTEGHRSTSIQVSLYGRIRGGRDANKHQTITCPTTTSRRERYTCRLWSPDTLFPGPVLLEEYHDDGGQNIHQTLYTPPFRKLHSRRCFGAARTTSTNKWKKDRLGGFLLQASTWTLRIPRRSCMERWGESSRCTMLSLPLMFLPDIKITYSRSGSH